tara:strand:+ start:514 stop:642 length:129 start_codon:yes stop_codon:yes gene_type:complete
MNPEYSFVFAYQQAEQNPLIDFILLIMVIVILIWLHKENSLK